MMPVSLHELSEYPGQTHGKGFVKKEQKEGGQFNESEERLSAEFLMAIWNAPLFFLNNP